MEDEGYQDFTIATAFERFVASIESCVATWAGRSGSAGLLRLQAQLQHRLPWRAEPYTLVLHLPPAAPGLPPPASEQVQAPALAPGALAPLLDSAALRDAPHRLQQWFGVGPFLLLTPDSYSGRVLEEEEVHTLLSAAAVALSHARISWPLLVPVHDAVRDGYRGVAVAPAAAGAATLHFDTDSLHSSRLSPGLLRPDQQLLLFARQLSAAGAAGAAAACRAAAGAELYPAPPSMAADAACAAAAGGSPGFGRLSAGQACQVSLAVRHCHALPDPGEAGDVDLTSSSGLGAGEELSPGRGEWEEQAPWRPWAAQADPIGCLELDLVWRFPSAAAAVQAHAAADSLSAGQHEGSVPAPLEPADASDWRLLALSTSYERDKGHRGFVLRPVDKPRRFLNLQLLAAPHAERILASRAEVAPDQLPGDSSFYGMLLKLLESCRWAAQAPDLGSMASAEWWLQQGAFQPPLAPDWVLQEATRDILQMAVLPVWPAFPPGTVKWPTNTEGQYNCLGKAAPLGSLISRFALHALALGSPRSVAELWSRFVGTLRLQYWEALQPLPRMRLGEQVQRQQQEVQQREQEGEQEGEQRTGGAPAGMAAGAGEDAPAGAAATAAASAGGGGGSSSGRPQAPNWEHSLLHQKLQLLDLCIHLLRQQRQQQQRRGENGSPQPQPALVSGEASAAAKGVDEQEDGWSWDSSDDASDDQAGAARDGAAQQRRRQRRRGQQQPPSPASSSSSYFSARGGSEAHLSPAKSEQQLQGDQEQESRGRSEQPAVGPTAADSLQGASPRGAAGAAGTAAAAAPPAGAGAAQHSQQPAEGSSPGSGTSRGAVLPVAAAAAAAEAQGVVGVLPGASLQLHPDQPLRVPAVQEAPAQTEDLMAERQAALQALPASPGQDVVALRMHLQGRMLLSDMQAFKAANPGCCLLDFVRWHSPKDAVQAADGSWHLSKRMAYEGNAWQQLWAAAAPVPAAQQRPLLDPMLEGERALHLLETVPPPALFSELLAVGYSAAVQLLRAAGAAAELPAVRRQLEVLAALAAQELRHGVAAEAATAALEAGNAVGRVGAGSAPAGPAPAAPNGATAAEAVRQQERRVDGDAQKQWSEGWEQDEDWDEEEDEEEEKKEEQDSEEESLEEEGLLEQIVGVGNQAWDHFAADEGGADPRQGWARRQPSWLRAIFASGISSSRYRRLLLLLGCAEQSVVAAHSLLLRLGGPAAAAAQQRQQQLADSGGSSGSVSDFVLITANELVASALGEGLEQGLAKPAAVAPAVAPAAPAAVASLPAAFRAAAEALAVQRWADEEAASDSASNSGRSAEGGGPGEWPAPFLREWLLQVHACPAAAHDERSGGMLAEPPAWQRPEEEPGAAAGACCRPVLQRMYVKALPLEVRIGTVLSAEPCSQA